MLFPSFDQFNFHCLQGPYSIVVFRALVCHGVVWSRLEEYFTFFRLKSSNGFFVKLSFGRSFIFCTFVCNDGALSFSLHVVVLPASVTLLWPGNFTYKLNMSGLVFLVLVSQSSNSSYIYAFFQVLFSLFLTVYEGHVQLMVLGSLCSTGFFPERSRTLFLFFLLSQIFKRFSRRNPFFRKVLRFL